MSTARDKKKFSCKLNFLLLSRLRISRWLKLRADAQFAVKRKFAVMGIKRQPRLFVKMYWSRKAYTTLSEKPSNFSLKNWCDIKQLLDEAFVISRIIEVEVRVISHVFASSLTASMQHKVYKLDMITPRNHAPPSYMTWLAVTLSVLDMIIV